MADEQEDLLADNRRLEDELSGLQQEFDKLEKIIDELESEKIDLLETIEEIYSLIKNKI